MGKRMTKSGVAERIFNKFGADKKKGMVALFLVGVMVFLWIRVLGKGGAEKASASPSPKVVSSNGKSEAKLKVSFVALPKVEGRNDILTHDFFSVGGGFIGEGGFSADSGSISEVLGNRLRLDAIEMGSSPQAFINDKLIGIGDIVVIKGGEKNYECEVVGIERNMVSIRCGEAEVKLKLTEDTEGGR